MKLNFTWMSQHKGKNGTWINVFDTVRIASSSFFQLPLIYDVTHWHSWIERSVLVMVYR
jgi:hypothetical protein